MYVNAGARLLGGAEIEFIYKVTFNYFRLLNYFLV
jgi:hypothetical protein